MSKNGCWFHNVHLVDALTELVERYAGQCPDETVGAFFFPASFRIYPMVTV